MTIMTTFSCSIASNYTDVSVFIRNYKLWILIHIMENYTKSMESLCALTKNMEMSFSSSSAFSKASSSESTASCVNCVTVSDTDVSVPARKKTKLSTKSTKDQLY